MSEPHRKTAMISSTAIDLPDHRRMVMDACLRMGFRPIMMDHLAGQDRSASEVSIGMVKDADVYLGIFAHAYGSNPENDARAFAEIEFDEALDLGITVIPFVMNDDYAWPPRLVDKGEKAEKLERLKEKVKKGRIVQSFGSPEDLRGLVIHALGEFEKQQPTPEDTTKVPDFHPPNIIPKPPEPYIAHPYSLLQTKDVVGRQAELNLLTDWVTANQQVPADTRIFNLVAIGGMGKSALTWKWFNDIAPNELPKLAGRMWWSFYESDAHYDNFIIRALAYVSGRSEKEVREMKSPEREDRLWQILDQQPFLLVLDGLERILLAYVRMDAAQMLDDDLDQETGHEERMFAGVPEDIRETYLQKHRLRKCIDANAGRFLRRLTTIRESRILISTRLYPAELQTNTAQPWLACAVQFVKGLSDDDAINLWREFGVTGSRDQLLKLFNTFVNYPLLIRALAGEIAEYRSAPGNFDQWIAENPEFNPGDLDLKNAKTHVLEYALRGLSPEHRKVLHTVAAFRMPATWDTLRALLVEKKPSPQAPAKPESGGTLELDEADASRLCPTDHALDIILTELEDRGLVGWDKKSNRYDLHPIVRGVVWHGLDGPVQQGIFQKMHSYFDALPKIDPSEVQTFEDLTPALEVHHKLVGLGRFEEALVVYSEHLHDSIYERLCMGRICVELLEHLLASDRDGAYRLSEPFMSYAFRVLAQSYRDSGRPSSAVSLLQRVVGIRQSEGDFPSVANNLCELALTLRLSGRLRASLFEAFRALKMVRANQILGVEPQSLREIGLGLSLVVHGDTSQPEIAFLRSVKLLRTVTSNLMACLSLHNLRLNQPAKALRLARKALELAAGPNQEFDVIFANRLLGAAAVAIGDVQAAPGYLHNAITRARLTALVDFELPCLTAMAELHRQRQQPFIARELLDQVWDLAERGPYPLFHADALNVLAQVERDEGNVKAAVDAATKGYTLAWCDGPPYAYFYGLTNARKHLQELGAPEPQLPPFNESKLEPMPDVELNPKDEFWVDPDKLDAGS